MMRGLGGLCGVRGEETQVMEKRQQSQPAVCWGKHYLGGKAVGNSTITWVEELWEFGPRSGKEC